MSRMPCQTRQGKKIFDTENHVHVPITIFFIESAQPQLAGRILDFR